MVSGNSSFFKYGMMVLSVVIICLSLPKQPRFRFEYEKGKVWMHDDQVAPYNFAILKTPTDLRSDREQVLRSVYPVYDHHTEFLEEEIARFSGDFENKWQSGGITEEEVSVYRGIGSQLLQQIYKRGIISLTKKFQIDGQHYNFTLVTNNVAERMNTASVLTRETAIQYLTKEVEARTAIKEKDWFSKVLTDYIQPNYIYNERLTQQLEEDALSSISTTRGMVQKGELIVANGAMVTNDVYQKLESWRQVYEEEARISGNRKIVVLGQFLVVGLVIGLLMVFLYLFRSDVYAKNRQLLLILMVVSSMLVVLSWAIKLELPSIYYIPFCIVPIIMRILFDTRMALNIHLLMVLVSGFFVPNGFEFAFLQVTAGMVSIYSIKTLIKREQFLVSALMILSTYLLAYLGVILMRDGSLADVSYLSFVPFVVSVLLTLLAYPLIYAFERVFGLTSDVTLMELTNTNSPLLRELSFKAPGTFQHSLQVANLAEAAIYRIGGNSLLVRAGALYHDIGKMHNPQFFIENQSKGYNPHDGLSYEQSAQIIIAHVPKGIDMAHKHQLPESVINFIRTHHGTTRTDYFYHRFVEENPDKEVEETSFRYPGPIPFSKETAVLMMADSVEAASRSIKEPDAENINKLVEKIIDGKLSQGQLKNSDITIQEIETIKEIFKRMLMSIYHVRVDYDKPKTGTIPASR